MKGPLSGIRVLSVTVMAAGPWAAMYLGDLGAEVIKIEGGDWVLRRGESPHGPSHKGEAYNYLASNRNQKSMLLDLTTEKGKGVFHELVKISDVVLDNFRVGILDKLGFDYDTLKRINPRIIRCSVTGYGQSGPYVERSAADVIVSALSGLTGLNAVPGADPSWGAHPFVDYSTGASAACGIIAALFQREKTGVGQKVEVSLLDTAVSYTGAYAQQYFLSGVAPKPEWGHHGSVPYGVYKTKDGSYLSTGGVWPRICLALNAEWLLKDPRFATDESRLQEENRNALQSIVKEIFLTQTREFWLTVLESYDIHAAPVNTVSEMAVDPQVVHNEDIVSVPHALGGEIKLLKNPIRMPGCLEGEYLAPPVLGQHTEEILTELLKYSPEEARRFMEEQKEQVEKLRKKSEARMRKFTDSDNKGVIGREERATTPRL